VISRSLENPAAHLALGSQVTSILDTVGNSVWSGSITRSVGGLRAAQDLVLDPRSLVM